MAMRENENGRFLFLLNHTDRMLQTELPEAGRGLLESKEYAAGDMAEIPAKGVQIIKLEKGQG